MPACIGVIEEDVFFNYIEFSGGILFSAIQSDPKGSVQSNWFCFAVTFHNEGGIRTIDIQTLGSISPNFLHQSNLHCSTVVKNLILSTKLKLKSELSTCLKLTDVCQMLSANEHVFSKKLGANVGEIKPKGWLTENRSIRL